MYNSVEKKSTNLADVRPQLIGTANPLYMLFESLFHIENC